MQKALIVLAGIFHLGSLSAQNTSFSYFSPKQNIAVSATDISHGKFEKAGSPYKTGFVKDGIIIAASAGATLAGYSLIRNKSNLTMEELETKTKGSLPFFDRFEAGNYSVHANKDSYILFDASYAITVAAALINGKESSKFGQIMVTYSETRGITGAI